MSLMIDTRLFSDWSMKSDNYNQMEWGDPARNACPKVILSIFLLMLQKNIFTRIYEQGESSFASN